MSNVPRRNFLARLAAGAAAFSAGFAAPRTLSAQQAESHELDKWIDELKGQHKQVYDCVTKARIGDMQFATNFLTANQNPYGLKDADTSVIVSLRHEATPFGFNDAMWEKYKIGESLKIPERPAGGRGGAAATDTTRAAGDTTPVVMATRNPQLRMITTLGGRGVQFTVCALATQRYAGEYARKTNQQMADVRTELLANLVPNCRAVAAGVVVVNRAQERGFTLLYIG
jgi:intracellular sulfur oxidation DsrE/DsrF family protein